MYTHVLGLLLSGFCGTADLSTESGDCSFAHYTDQLRRPFAAFPDSGSGSTLHCIVHPDDPGAVLIGTLTIALPPEVAVDGEGSYISDEVCFWSVSGGGVDIIIDLPEGCSVPDSALLSEHLNRVAEVALMTGQIFGYLPCGADVRVIATPPILAPCPIPSLFGNEGEPLLLFMGEIDCLGGILGVGPIPLSPVGIERYTTT